MCTFEEMCPLSIAKPPITQIKGLHNEDFGDFCPNYPEISELATIQSIIIEHVKEDITFIRKEKTNHGR